MQNQDKCEHADTSAPRLDSDSRLGAIKKLEIVDQPTERNFELLVELANSLLGTPVSLISIVTDNRQFFAGASGLGEPWASQRETPLSHSFCQHVVLRDAPLIVSDSRIHPLVCENLAVPDLDVVAYLGYPLRTEDGLVLGSFCVIDCKPREWSPFEIETVGKLAKIAVSELNVRIATLQEKESYERQLRQSAKMKAIGQFTAGVAHDFNNVLTAIQVYADLLQSKPQDESNTQMIAEKIEKSVTIAANIVKQISSFGRPLRESLSPNSIFKIVADSIDLIENTVPANVSVVFDHVSGKGKLVATRPELLHQVLLNLCKNAADAIGTETGVINIRLREKSLDLESARVVKLSPGRYVELHVSDDGSGIPTDIIDRLQEPYFTTKPIGYGTGLGLWTVFEIVREHGGETFIESELGVGTTVTVLLPEYKQIPADPTPGLERSSTSTSA